MTSLDLYRDAALSRVDSRRVGRSLARLDGQTAFDLARIDQVTDLAQAKTDSVSQVGGHAMQRVAMLSQLEQQLAQTVPLANSRLQAIADLTTMGAARSSSTAFTGCGDTSRHCGAAPARHCGAGGESSPLFVLAGWDWQRLSR
jgi:hypothetical protein